MANYVSAADYANSEAAKTQYAANMKYQAANPTTSSYLGQANDSGSAAYVPSTTSTSQVGGSGGMRNGVSTTAYSDWRTKNWNEMSNDQRNAWDKKGRNFSELDDPNYLSRINTPMPSTATPQTSFQLGDKSLNPPAYDPKFNYSTNTPMPQTTPQTTQGLADPAKVGAIPTNTGPSTATGLGDPAMAGSSQQQGTVKDAQGNIIGYFLPGGGFAPVTGQGSQQQTTSTNQMGYTPTGGSMGNNMGVGAMEQAQFNTPQQTNGSASSVFNTKTPAQITAEAKTRTDALLAKQTTIANQTKQGFNTSYDRLSATTKDDRTLQDASTARSSNPFSGGTGYRQDITNREREISDRQSKEDLQTRLANVDLSLADYANATEAQRMQMEDQMTQAERAYGMQVDQFNLQRQGQNFNQGIQMAGITGKYNGQDTMQQIQNNFNNGIAYAGLTGKYNGQDTLQKQQMNQTQSNADRQYNAGRQDASSNATGYYNPSGMTLNQINQEIAKNSASYANASPEQKQLLHQRNIELNGLLGKTDSTGNGDYVGGNPNGQVGYRTIQGQQSDMNNTKDMAILTGRLPNGMLTNAAQQDRLKNLWTVSEQSGTIHDELADLYGIARGTQTMQAKQLAVQIANQKSQQDNINTDNSLAQKKFDWDTNPANPNNIYKNGQADAAANKGKPTYDTVKKSIQSNQTLWKNETTTDEYDKVHNTGRKIPVDKAQLENSIIGSGVSLKEMGKLYQDFFSPAELKGMLTPQDLKELGISPN